MTSHGADVIKVIEQMSASWDGRPDEEVLQALSALEPLADEDHPCWTDEYWKRVAHPYLALASVAAERRLRPAIRLLLDRASFGDPGETMRGLRHTLEAIVAPDWGALAEECLSAASSKRRGTRLWALNQLAILDDPRAKPVFEAALVDPSPEIRVVGEMGLRRLAQR